MRLRVWAPRVTQVELVTASERRALRPTAGGHWELPDPPLPAGMDYRFSLDGGEPLADPRSRYQPEGVHGPSRVVDPSAFPWTDATFQAPPLGAGLVYELHVGTFTPEGTFDAVISRLGHLEELGVTHLQLMPVNEFPGRHGWGYDGVFPYAVQHSYGGPEGLVRLVNACHARGIAVLLDVVYNHIGPDGDVLEAYGPYFTGAYSTFWGPALNLDQAESDAVRRFVCDSALSWLRDYHLDGLRIDAVHAFFDRSAKHLLEQLAEEVAALATELGRHLVLIAESDLNDPRLLWPRSAGGYGLDAQWSDDLHHCLHALLTGERTGYYADFGTVAQLARALEQAYVYQGEFAPARRRAHGRSPAGVPRSAFLGYLQTHDQIGNRARGERIGQQTSAERVAVGAALVLTSPSVPMLFQGEEWNASTPFCYFTDHTKPGLAERVRQGRQAEFGAFGWRPEEIPDPNDPDTFRRSTLDFGESEREPHATMLAWYRALARLRRTVPELRTPLTRVRYDESAQWLALERRSTLVAANLGSAQVRVECPAEARVLLASPAVALEPGAVSLPPASVAILGWSS